MLLLALVLRLHGIHDPLLDHPGWRQGDTGSIARNFALLQYNILYPQTNYDGPPPNYVELELQIVPFLAATLYKIVGVHEIFGRLITIAFSLGTVAALWFFARWLFVSEIAAFFAAFAYAVMPASIYYGRAFTPDATMVFFLTCALFAAARLFVDSEVWKPRAVAGCAALLALAYLAKPVAVAALLPLATLFIVRLRSGRTVDWPATAALFAAPLIVLWTYDAFVAGHAEWHWASGITAKHVVPALARSFQSTASFSAKLMQFKGVLSMLAAIVWGPPLTALTILGLAFMPKVTRSPSLLWSWLASGLLYAYVVVTVERVDYYLLLLAPLAALAAGGFLSRFWQAIAESSVHRASKIATLIAGAFALAGMTVESRTIIQPYYRYSKAVFRNARALDAMLPAGTLIVMGHYDPSVLYYIGRYGWEEDPYLWTPFDQESAIRKGARYFIDIETNRFNRNVELCAWMQRFPLVRTGAKWPVYHTDPALLKPGAEAQWRAFRNAERAGAARQWLDARGLCPVAATEGAAANPKA